MKRFRKNFAFLLVFIVLILAGGAWYMGCMETYEVDVRSMGPYNFVYEEYTGSYAQSGAVFSEIHDALINDGIGSSVSLGIYYDNPDDVSRSELRSELGYVIDDVQAATLPAGYSAKVIDANGYAVVAFPYKNMLSYLVGPNMVYPVFEEYFGDDYQAEYSIELYTADTIYYMMPGEELCYDYCERACADEDVSDYPDECPMPMCTCE